MSINFKCFLCLFFIALQSNCWSITIEAFEETASDKRLRANTFDPIYRQFLIDNCVNAKTTEALVIVNKVLLNKLKLLQAGRISKEQLLIIDQLCSLAQVLELCSKNKLDFSRKKPFAEFLFSSHEKVSKLGEAFLPEDNVKEAFVILHDLYKPEEEKAREEYFDLKLAIALVWDQDRPQIHDQVSYRYTSKFQPELSERYIYFKTLYDKHKSKMKYRFLDYKDLIYVVDTPIPIAELEWVKKEVKGTLTSWGRQYSKITYATQRLNDGVYDWPGEYQGMYTLSHISQYGGICVDQAYYCTLTARAFGIPALYFEGMGKRGGHAWCSFMKKEDSWEFNVGRYQSDKYVIGSSINPQTNLKMTDHEVSNIYSRAFRNSSYKKGHKYQFFAQFLYDKEETQLAYAFAKYAAKIAPLNTRCWDILHRCVDKLANEDLTIKYFDDVIKAFKGFPDIIVKSQIEKVDYLKKIGKKKEADKLLEVSRRRVDKKRDDLERTLSLKIIRDFLDANKPVEARKEMEATLKKQRNLDAKVFTFVEEYLDMTLETNQTKEAARFIPTLMKPMCSRVVTEYRYHAARIMAEAYTNNNEKKKADRIIKRYIK